MAKLNKSGDGKDKKGSRGIERGARRDGNAIILYRQEGDTVHEVTYREGVLIYKNKHYTSLKEVAEAVRGKEISGSGRTYFGLRHNGFIELGKEVWKGLKAANKEAEKPKKAAKKGKRVDDEEDEAKASKSNSKSVGEVVAKVFGKGRK